jgi:hypothetical protein
MRCIPATAVDLLSGFPLSRQWSEALELATGKMFAEAAFTCHQ